MRRTKATLIYRRTGNLRAVQLLLGHTKNESAVRYLGVEVDDALEIADRGLKYTGRAAVLCPSSDREQRASYRFKRRCNPYSITSSASASSLGGISRPIAFAVFKLITSSNFVGSSTGRSSGLAPFRILST